MAAITGGVATVYRITENAPVQLATQTITDSDFGLDLPVTDTGYYYMALQVTSYLKDGTSYPLTDRNISLLAVFDGTSTIVSVGVQSTIANAFAFAQMTRIEEAKIIIAGTERQMRIAYGMKNNFLQTYGTVSKVIASSPNGLETNSYPLFNFLAALVYYNITDAAVYQDFLTLSAQNAPATSFFQALMNIVHEPFTNVQAIYQLISTKEQILHPSLPTLTLPEHKSPLPDQWTLTIKANDSGAQNFLMSGLAYVVFDKEDKAWITNNFRQGSAFSGTHCIVLNADASPANISPITGGGLLGTAFGAAVDPSGERIAIGNFGWGPELFNPQHGSISMFSYKGEVLSPANGFTNKLSRVQGMCYDQKGNLWMASVGTQMPFAPAPIGVYEFESQNSAVVVYIGGDPEHAFSYDNFNGQPSPYHSTFDVAMDHEGYAYVSNIGNGNTDDPGNPGIPSSVHKFRLDENGLTCVGSWTSEWLNPRNGLIGYEELRQVAINSKNEVFVVGITSSRVIQLATDLSHIVQTFDANINAPWGITIDGRDTMFMANFAQEKGRDPESNSLDMQGPYGVSVIRPEYEGIARLMTVPTGGAEVMLRNGLPLYGAQTGPEGQRYMPPSYEPIMRLTATGIDGAGNLWCVNNWKPSAAVDVRSNPGGDGVVIFIGVAKPS